MRRAVHGYYPRREQGLASQNAGWRAHADRNSGSIRRLRNWAGTCQACSVSGGTQSLQALESCRQKWRCRARKIQYFTGWPHGLRQDIAGTNTGAHTVATIQTFIAH